MPIDIAAFALTAFLIELTPGPNMAYLALIAAVEGRRAGLAVLVGVALGLAVMGLAAAMGLAVLIQSDVWVYQALRWAGVLYLFYLAWEGWRGSEGAEGRYPASQSHWLHFRRGLISNLLNPKAAIFYITVLPEFLTPEAGLSGTLILGLVYVSIASAVHLAIVLAAGSAQGWLASPERTRTVRRILALALVGVALWILAKS